MPAASGSTDRTAAVKRELLVRYLEAWAPAALHRGRRATYLHGYADADGGQAAEAALRVFAELADMLRGRSLAMVAVAADAPPLQRRLNAVQADLDTPPALMVHVVPGATDERLAVALKAARAAGAPLLGHLDATAGTPPAMASIAALGSGRPAELLLVLGRRVLPDLAAGRTPAVEGDRLFGDDRWRDVSAQPGPRRYAHLVDRYRSALRDAGFPLVAAVELVAGDGELVAGTGEPVAGDGGSRAAADHDDGELVVFATSLGKSLEAFKNALWAVDEYAGVRYRDPRDVERHLLDIALTPHPGPLRRELLDQVAAVGACTVSDLRRFTLTDTVYRASDATRVLAALVSSGAVSRSPGHGRLGGDVVIAPGAVVLDPGGG